MQKVTRVLPWSVCLVVVSALLSCAQSVSHKSDPEPTPKLGALISALPDIASSLPKSLQDGVATASARYRAAGEVTTLDPATLSGVRSEGYVQVKEVLTTSPFGSMLQVLKAGIADKDVPLDTDVRLGIVTLPEGESAPDGSSTMDIGVIRATKVGAVTQVKWTINLSMGTNTAAMYIYLELEGDSTTNLKAKYAVSCDALGMNVVGSYDATSGKTAEVYLPSADGPGQYTVMTNQGGVVHYYMVLKAIPDYPDTESLYIAYGTDAMGGLVYKNSGQESGHFVFSEFYNGRGDLVESVYGNSTDTSLGDFSDDFENGFNVRTVASTRPDSVKIRHTYTYGAGSEPSAADQLSVDGGSTWVTINAEDYENKAICWVAGSAPAAGDSIYYYASSSANDGTWDAGAQTYTFVSTVTYEVGYAVPTPQTYFGADLYATATFPLKYLRPENGLPLKQREGDAVTVDFVDENGVTQTYTFSVKDYWLENTNWKNKDGSDDNSDDTLDADKGDIPQDRLDSRAFYNWDPTTEEYVESSAYVMVTTESSPVGWQFEAGAQAVVEGVKDSLTTLYNQVPTNLSADLQTEADAIVKMPDTTTFPRL